MYTFRIFFDWPTGAVWSNILASIMWVIPGYLWGRFHVKKIHNRLNTNAENITQIHNHLNPDHPYTIGGYDGSE